MLSCSVPPHGERLLGELAELSPGPAVLVATDVAARGQLVQGFSCLSVDICRCGVIFNWEQGFFRFRGSCRRLLFYSVRGQHELLVIKCSYESSGVSRLAADGAGDS